MLLLTLTHITHAFRKGLEYRVTILGLESQFCGTGGRSDQYKWKKHELL